jgi:O-antigen biosynthesis protein
MNKVLIAITTYNRISFTKQCIESLYKNTNICFDLVIFDNNSTDGTIEYLNSLKYDNIKIIYSKENVGVAKAINEVLKLRNKEQHFMKLDNDMVIDDNVNKNWLNNICNILNSNIKVLINEQDFNIGALCLKPDKLLKDFPKIIELDIIEENGEKLHYNFEFNPEGVLGCCTIYNKNIFDNITKFNEDMGLYGFEDSLINIRLFKLKYLSFFETNTKCYHIDPGGDTDYLKWKHKQAQDNYPKYLQIYNDYTTGKRDARI